MAAGSKVTTDPDTTYDEYRGYTLKRSRGEGGNHHQVTVTNPYGKFWFVVLAPRPMLALSIARDYLKGCVPADHGIESDD